MANKIVREIIHAKGIDIGIYTKIWEYPKVCVNLQTDVR